GISGMDRLSRRYLLRAIAVADEIRDPPALAYAHFVRSLYLVGRGAWAETLDGVEVAQRLCDQLGDQLNWCNAQAVRFWLCYHTGNDAGAQEAAAALENRALHAGNRQQAAWGIRSSALMLLRYGGTPESAVELLQRSVHVAGEDIGDRAEAAPTWGALAVAQLRADRIDQALESALKGLDHIRAIRSPTGHGTLEGYSMVLDVLLEAWRRGEPARAQPWRHCVSQGLRAFRRFVRVFPIGEPAYGVRVGRVLALRGKRAAAIAQWQRSEQLARNMGMRPEAERARQLHGVTDD
ncbi:MAG: hypothetical protein ACI9WU_002336, partial [Myxococcota bacterium]